MISITPVPIESDLCTTTNTFKRLDIELVGSNERDGPSAVFVPSTLV